MRTGPGTRYPIEWVFRREGLPVEITAEYDVWRRVKDWEGAEGWVHQSALSGRRMLLVAGEGKHEVKAQADATSATVALAASGAIGRILLCEETWCEVQFEDVKGYMPKNMFWGAYPAEKFE